MKLPKSFRTEKNLEDKTNQLIGGAKSRPEIPHIANGFDTIYQELAFYKGKKYEGVLQDKIRIKYHFEEGNYSIHFDVFFEKDSREYFGDETLVYETGLRVRFDINDGNEYEFTGTGMWEKKLKELHRKYILEGEGVEK